LTSFDLEITSRPATESIHSIMLQAQIQIQSAQPQHNTPGRKQPVERVGPPLQSRQTLRNALWAIASTNVGAFTGGTVIRLPVACTFDQNIAVTKYWYALENEDVPLLFLFSGTVFYAGPDGHLLVQPISLNKEATFRVPVESWRKLMDTQFPNSGWLYLNREAFERLYSYKCQHGLPNWEQVVERLLPAAKREEVLV
jgi:hypothetical protein